VSARESAACPLCGSTEGTAELRIPYEDIWKALAAQWGVFFSEEVRRRHQVAPEVTLVRCNSCGLEYFSPIAPGDEAFYEELMASIPYHEDRWEFGIVERVLPSGVDVLDLGCGRGAFLRRIASRVRRAVGVDHNRNAIADLRKGGIEAYAEDFELFAGREGRAFDVVCAFHTLEHLPKVDVLLRPAIALARTGGRIFISVPNRNRVGRLSLEPLDCPPQHVSRWASSQFRILADLHNLEFVAVRYEEPDLSHARLWFGEWLLSRIGLSPGPGDGSTWAGLVGRLGMGQWRYSRAVRAGRFASRHVFGHSMIAEFRVPTDQRT
jgi:2-polyprenyl-3-methyl-5-hydroxy-6-metoxy-1,4-benzoquinol methylase